MPVPKKGERKDKYIPRCMSDAEMRRKYPDRKQRYAVCLGIYKSEKPK